MLVLFLKNGKLHGLIDYKLTHPFTCLSSLSHFYHRNLWHMWFTYNVLSEHHWKQKRNSLTLLTVFIFLKTLYTLENYFVCLYIIIYFVFLYRLYFITSQWDTEAQVKYCGYNQKLMSELRFSLFASKAQTLCITSNCFFPPIKESVEMEVFCFCF